MTRLYPVLVCICLIFTFYSCQKNDDIIIIPDNESQETIYYQYGTPFKNVPSTQDILMYEVNLRAFSSHVNIQGVINNLENIQDLSVNVIWLMPIHPVGKVNSVNSPYSVRDYKAIGSEYGTLDDLRRLTDEAHSKGIAVMLDWVANHIAWDNEWIQNYSWYTQNGSGDIITSSWHQLA